MDSSTKLKFLTGSLSLRAKEIDPETWSKLISHCIKECKPHLKYFPEQKPISEMLNCMLGDYDKRITSAEVVVLPADVTTETKCFHLAGLKSQLVPHPPIPGVIHVHTGAHDWKSITEKQLLLSSKGVLLLWTAEYHPELVHGLGFRAHREGTYYKAKNSKFEIVSPKQLTELLGSENYLGYHVIQILSELCETGITAREHTLSSMRQLSNHFSRIRDCIEVSR